MESYRDAQQTNIAQSSIGFQVYVWDTSLETAKFNYLVPVVGDPPEMGGEPSTIETTEADSPVKTYVSDRPDSPSITFNYNFDENGNNYLRVKSNISSSTAHIYLMLLPLGSAFIVKGTGATWMAGGNPIQGAFSLSQAEEAIFVPNLDKSLPEDTVTAINAMLGSGTVTSTSKLKDIIALNSMPVGRETDAVKKALAD